MREGYVPWLAKCQLAVQCKDINADGSHGRLRDATSVQNHGAVDDVFGGYEGPLGVAIERGSSGGFAGFGGGVKNRDAASVTVACGRHRAARALRLFDRASGDDPSFDTEMTESADGVWTVIGPIDWEGTTSSKWTRITRGGGPGVLRPRRRHGPALAALGGRAALAHR